MKTAEVTLYDDDDREIIVTLQRQPGSRGARDSIAGVRGAGPPLEPDEGPSWEILSAVTEDEKPVTLTSQQEAEAIEEAGDNREDVLDVSED